MKEKIFRFNNGFIGTMNEFCLKFGTSKEKNYRNALKWVGRRYNVMTASSKRHTNVNVNMPGRIIGFILGQTASTV